jgi:hypothetical protein
MGKWLKTFIDQNDGSSDFNDSDKVVGWLSACLDSDVLTVTYKPSDDSEFRAATEWYRVSPLSEEGTGDG